MCELGAWLIGCWFCGMIWATPTWLFSIIWFMVPPGFRFPFGSIICWLTSAPDCGLASILTASGKESEFRIWLVRKAESIVSYLVYGRHFLCLIYHLVWLRNVHDWLVRHRLLIHRRLVDLRVDHWSCLRRSRGENGGDSVCRTLSLCAGVNKAFSLASQDLSGCAENAGGLMRWKGLLSSRKVRNVPNEIH